MNVAFLDFDGVLNHQRWYRQREELMKDRDYEMRQYPYSEICPETIANMNRLTEATGVKYVISSSWRMGRRIEDLQEVLSKCGFTGDVIDVTPYFGGIGRDGMSYGVPRGCEIDWWLDKHGFKRINWSKPQQAEILNKSKVKNYIILDDDEDMLYTQREHFIKCNAYGGGFDEKCLERAIKILNTDLTELYKQDEVEL